MLASHLRRLAMSAMVIATGSGLLWADNLFQGAKEEGGKWVVTLTKPLARGDIFLKGPTDDAKSQRRWTLKPFKLELSQQIPYLVVLQDFVAADGNTFEFQLSKKDNPACYVTLVATLKDSKSRLSRDYIPVISEITPVSFHRDKDSSNSRPTNWQVVFDMDSLKQGDLLLHKSDKLTDLK